MKTLRNGLLALVLISPLWALGSSTRETVHDVLIMKQNGGQPAADTGTNRCYTKTDNRLYCTDSSGSENAIGGGSGVTGGATANYIPSGSRDAEFDTGIWTSYNDVFNTIGTPAVAASLTLNGITYTTTAGAAGNGLSVLVQGSAGRGNGPLALSTLWAASDNELVVYPAFASGGALTSTRQNVVDAINAGGYAITASCSSCATIVTASVQTSLSGGVDAILSGTQATLTVNGVLFTAKAIGTYANAMALSAVIPGAAGTILASYVSGTITIALATSDTVTSTSTRTNVVNAVNGDSVLSTLVTASCASSCATIFTAGSGTLSGGVGAGATTPTDGAGGAGSGVLALTRSTAARLNGAGSFQLDKLGGLSCQGEGKSVLFSIPEGYQAKNTQIRFPYRVISGSVVQGDIKAYIYDVIGGKLISPAYNDIVGARGTLSAVFSPNINAGFYRLLLHCSSTSTAAWDVHYDDVEVSPYPVPLGLAGSDGTAYTPASSQGFGTLAATDFKWWRRGDLIYVQGNFTAGTTAASEARMALPSGLTIDSSVSSNTLVGVGDRSAASNGVNVLAAAGNTFFQFGNPNDAAGLTAQVGSTIVGTGEVVKFVATVKISGWSSNVQMASSAAWLASTYLASGTRVTATPAKYGEYRTYKKVINDSSGTDDAPTAPPATSDGMRVFGVAYNAAGTGGQPCRWEAYVGKNRDPGAVQFRFYKTTGRSGWINTNPQDISSTSSVGIVTAYDTASGVALVDACWANLGTNTSHVAGIVPGVNGGNTPTQADAYFDIVVSENALSVGQDTTNIVSTCTNCRTETAKVSCYTAAVVSQNGSWITGISNRATAKCSLTLVTGLFSAAPFCNTTRLIGATASEYTDVNPTSTTNVDLYNSSAGDYDTFITCTGKM